MSCCGPADTASLFSITQITKHCDNLVSASKNVLYLSTVACIYYIGNISAEWAIGICSAADAAVCYSWRGSNLLIFEFFIPELLQVSSVFLMIGRSTEFLHGELLLISLVWLNLRLQLK